MKVLLIGQLPKEIGGNYTTGAANVVYELGKQKPDDTVYYTYGTNIRFEAAKKASKYPNQYMGYTLRPLRIIFNAIKHPFSTLRHWRHYRSIDHQNFLRYAFYEDNIRTAIKNVNPDIIHVNSINNVSPVRYALGERKIPLLLTCHGIFYRGDKYDVINRDRALGNIGLADAYSGLTNESLDEYETILGVPKEKVVVISNGIDCSKFYYSEKEREIVRKEHDVDSNCKVFITVASVQERKGQLEFLKILQKLDLDDFQYWIIGKGPDEEDIKKFIEDNALLSNVRLLGYRTANELYKYYSAADIYAHSSWKEGQALSELEANATGLRTVVNKAITGTIGGDINSDDYFVLDFDNIDYDAFEKWIRTGQNVRQSKTTFDWSIIANRYYDWYLNNLNNNESHIR